jgi:hypothetical protein
MAAEQGRLDPKILVARAQLGTALWLFIHHKDPISVHSLAAGAAEVLYGIGKHTNQQMVSTHILSSEPSMTEKDLTRLRGQHWNAFKHFFGPDHKTPRDDAELIESFNDHHNDAILFTAWGDYGVVRGGLPVEAQIFQVWWYANNEPKLAPGARTEFRQIFPDLPTFSRSEQKRRLRRVIDKFKGDRRVMQDPRTEAGPLMAGASA